MFDEVFTMRRKDKEITDINEIIEMISNCDYMRLGFSADNYPYIVPMNFGYEYKDNKLYFYFHGASAGRKASIIKNGLKAAFEMDKAIQLVESEYACNYTMKYESVMGGGSLKIIEDTNEKLNALKIIMSHYSKNNDFQFNPAMVEKTLVFILKVEEISAKAGR